MKYWSSVIPAVIIIIVVIVVVVIFAVIIVVEGSFVYCTEAITVV